MKKCFLCLAFLLSGNWGQAAPMPGPVSLVMAVQEAASTIIGRCQRYTEDTNRSCQKATLSLYQVLQENVPRKDTSMDILTMGVVFKPELLEFFKNPETNRLLDFWLQEMNFMSVTQQWNTSLFDKTAEFLGSEEKAFQAFAVLLHDTTPFPPVLEWIRWIDDPAVRNFDLEKFQRLLAEIQAIPEKNANIFYPSLLWKPARDFLRKPFYHFYVPAYMYKKMKIQVDAPYAATVVFLFNYLYENYQENGLKARFFEPAKMRSPKNLNDIRLAYLASNWVDYKKDLPRFYAQTAFLHLKEEHLKQNLHVWIDRFFQ